MVDIDMRPNFDIHMYNAHTLNIFGIWLLLNAHHLDFSYSLIINYQNQ